MKLYYAPGTCALACWISLEWANADYEVEKVTLGSKEYLAINPLGMVPALELEDGQILTQAGAILNFIAKKFPQADLACDDSLLEEFTFNEIMDFLTGDFNPAFWPIFFPKRYTTSQSKEELDRVLEAAYKRVDIAMTHLDKIIGSHQHVYHNKRTVADAYAYVMALWADKTPKSYQDYPNIARFMAAMQADKTVAKVIKASAE
ncbi:glutathione S-transferase family protein [Streptococcus ictaluri]|uniref:Glutathione S-transferase, N-terminal domain protein n=1 Tax=Streptococcus ictaluri 707-05 TaxID=764299 RepID=G5K690_9STRE|nr:glutathione S-transferase N-terminal domain-containing protein [Streptococcus ictaluri]EHI68712.1 glutathione S-transferase, N-terminal domain protein [Streptococcus ictaluri 707-05]